MNTFGDRLRAGRTARGFTQDELAARMDVSKSAISAWENNREFPSFEKLPKLRAALETTLDDLVCGDSEVGRMSRQYLAIAEGGAATYLAHQESVSRDEMRLLRAFRGLPDRRRKAMLTLLATP